MKRPPIGDGSGDGDRSATDESSSSSSYPEILKKKRIEEEDAGAGRGLPAAAAAAPDLGEDLVFEVLKRADARTLATAACVSRRWREMAEDERLWEGMCLRHWPKTGCGAQQLSSVVMALGGFRRLHAHCLFPLEPSSRTALQHRLSSSSSSSRRPARWGKDEVQLSLSLLSIRYFENMSGHKRPAGDPNPNPNSNPN